jgi:hypothetical protein
VIAIDVNVVWALSTAHAFGLSDRRAGTFAILRIADRCSA